jgi:hypothetical protein
VFELVLFLYLFKFSLGLCLLGLFSISCLFFLLSDLDLRLRLFGLWTKIVAIKFGIEVSDWVWLQQIIPNFLLLLLFFQFLLLFDLFFRLEVTWSGKLASDVIHLDCAVPHTFRSCNLIFKLFIVGMLRCSLSSFNCSLTWISKLDLNMLHLSLLLLSTKVLWLNGLIAVWLYFLFFWLRCNLFDCNKFACRLGFLKCFLSFWRSLRLFLNNLLRGIKKWLQNLFLLDCCIFLRFTIIIRIK